MLPEDKTTKELRAKKTRVVIVPEKGDNRREDELEPRGTKRPAPTPGGIGGESVKNVEVEDEDEDEEDEEDEESGEENHENKRLKTSKATTSGPIEFTEEDIAWQLEAMAEEYGLEEEDLGEGEEMTEEENIGMFKVQTLRKFCQWKSDRLLTSYPGNVKRL